MSETARAHDGAARGRRTHDMSVSEIASQLPEQLSRLVGEELRLAQIEMTQKGKRAGVGAGMLGGGGVVAGYGSAAALAAIILALAESPAAGWPGSSSGDAGELGKPGQGSSRQGGTRGGR